MDSCQGNEVMLSIFDLQQGLDSGRKTEGLLADTSTIPQEPVEQISV